MSLCCQYCHRLFSRIDSRIRHEKHSCQSSGSEKTREVLKITFPTEKNHGIPNEIELGEAFGFKTPSSILIVGPSGCGKTCFTESLLLDHLEELFVSPLPKIHYCVARWIPRHGIRWHTILRRGSYRLPFTKMVSERWFIRIR